MKILILSDGIPPYIIGGMQRHTANLVKYLVQAGVEVELIHCYNELEKSHSHQDVEQELFERIDVAGFTSLIAIIDLTPKQLESMDAVLIATNHSEVDYEMVCKHAPLVVDTRNVCAGFKKFADKIVVA